MTGSPCVNICTIERAVCAGCGRTLEEISNWATMSMTEKTLWWDSHPIYYAGIGSRNTPSTLLPDLSQFSLHLEQMGYCLRSGGALGADQAFEKNVLRKEIFLASSARGKAPKPHTRGLDEINPLWVKKSYEIAEKHHRGWKNLSDYAKKLMARNVMQVLGEDLNHPVQFVFCWAEKVYFDDQGRIKNVGGGTGLAVRLAYSLGIPVVHTHLEAFKNFQDSVLAHDFKNIHLLCNIMAIPVKDPNPLVAPLDPPTPKLRWKRT